jgi:Ca-activated chloride channel homolog
MNKKQMNKKVMRKRSGLVLIMLMAFILAYGQNERKAIREGIKAYEDGEYSEAEVQFRKAENINHESYEAEFNTGTALYGQKKYDETAKQFQSLLDQTEDSEKTAKIWHNIGNSLLEAKQYGPSIEAYKNALRKNPSDQDTKYNLAYAKEMLKEQQQQQNNKDQKQNNKDQQGQDKNKDQQDKKQEQADQNKNQDQQPPEKNEDQQQKQQPASREISKEDAQRMLDAIQHQEKQVKEKVDKKKAAAAKVKTEKDW